MTRNNRESEDVELAVAEPLRVGWLQPIEWMLFLRALSHVDSHFRTLRSVHPMAAEMATALYYCKLPQFSDVSRLAVARMFLDLRGDPHALRDTAEAIIEKGRNLGIPISQEDIDSLN